MTTTTPTMGTVLPLTAATDYRIAGRKAATLARLAGAGFPVPPGVVVPAAVMERATSGDGEVPGEVAMALLDAVRAWGDVPLAPSPTPDAPPAKAAAHNLRHSHSTSQSGSGLQHR